MSWRNSNKERINESCNCYNCFEFWKLLSFFEIETRRELERKVRGRQRFI